MTTCYLIRHGTTAWVDENILHGITDIPLNENGINQAKETARALKGIKVDLLFTSPLSRAFQTAEIIGRELDLKPIPVEEMKELDFGWLEGKKFVEDDQESSPSLCSWFNQLREDFIRGISGETRKKLSGRVIEGWQKILDRSQGQNFILVAHSAVFNVLLYHYFDARFTNHQKFYSIHPGGISELLLSKNSEAELVRLDDHAHLEAWYAKKE